MDLPGALGFAGAFALRAIFGFVAFDRGFGALDFATDLAVLGLTAGFLAGLPLRADPLRADTPDRTALAAGLPLFLFLTMVLAFAQKPRIAREAF
ncbi:MAG: hypothetical protein ACRECX_02605 [Methyloceanibacter sp.]|uniref:hypothetical protein n=1 Tax=Methyloceanibacter sp. TaxID=1965321 RepID=UPI003D6CB0D8